jgi:hypothetical protein
MTLFSRFFGHQSPPSIERMIEFLLDRTQDLGSRDDVAMELSDSDDARVEEVLVRLATDPSEDEMLVDQAGHSLWLVWQRKGVRPEETIAKLLPSARKFFGPELHK